MLAISGLAGPADVGPASLPAMLERSDGVIAGRIADRSVREIDAGDGAPLYLTTLAIIGTDLARTRGDAAPGDAIRVDVSFAGGFLDETRGGFVASAPPRDHTRVGRDVVAFYRHEDDLVGGVSGNALVGAGSGLFTAFRSRRGAVIVQGRGRGTAIPRNIALNDLKERAIELETNDDRPR